MATVFMERNLFKDATKWIPKIDPAVNNPMSKLFMGTQMPAGGMLIHNALDQPWAGAMISNTAALPKYNGKPLPYAAWHLEFCFNPATFDDLARFEADNKTCVKSRAVSTVKIRNVCNWSVQWNRDTGQIQIDHDPPGWVNSGFVPSPKVTTPGVRHSLDFRYSFNMTNMTFSIESIQWDDEFYAMPAQHKNIPMTLTNWTECRKLQLQNEGYRPGTVLYDVSNGVMAWSDAPITVMPNEASYDKALLSYSEPEAEEDWESFPIRYADPYARTTKC